jgi:predicted GNAT family N-acyltransferase
MTENVSAKESLNQDFLIEQVDAPDPATLEAIGRLRVIAWEHDGERPKSASNCGDVWLDDHDNHACHWTVKKNGALVAAARVCLHSSGDELPDASYIGDFKQKIVFPAAFFNRLVVHPSARGMGLSGRLDKARLKFATEHGTVTAVVTASKQPRLQQLQAAGWNILGEISERFISKLPNYFLTKSLLS